MTSETWLPIPGYPGYEVSDMGNVRSFYTKQPGTLGGWRLSPNPQRVLKPSTNKGGYKHVNLQKDSKRTGHKVHKLVMLAFVGPRPEGLEICHGPGGPGDNRLSNLRYDTHQANMEEAAQSGNMGGSLTSEEASRVIELSSQGLRLKDIAETVNVSLHIVSFLLNGKTYKHVPGERVTPTERSQERAGKIRQDYATGYYTMTELAREYGMDLSAISLIINNKRCIETEKEQAQC